MVGIFSFMGTSGDFIISIYSNVFDGLFIINIRQHRDKQKEMTNKEFRDRSYTNAQYKRIIWLVADFNHKDNLHIILSGGTFIKSRVEAFNDYFLDKKSKLYIK